MVWVWWVASLRVQGCWNPRSRIVALREIRGYHEIHFTDVSEEPAASVFRVVDSAQGYRPCLSFSYICITFSEAQLNLIP
jgi:hypothetical protein